MAKKDILVDIDFNQNQLLNPVLQNLPEDPSTGVEGQKYFNTTNHIERIYRNGAWQNATDEYELPAASTNTRGGVKVGNRLYIENEDVLNVHRASKVIEGIGRFATDAEVEAGTQPNVAIDPVQLKSVIDSLPTPIQSDWNQTNNTALDYIKNKPDISGTITRQIVATLPIDDIDPNCIYMVLKSNPEMGNYYDEYMYINNAWELIGNTAGGTAKNVFYGYTTNNNYNINATVPDFTLENGNIAIIRLDYATGNGNHQLSLNINNLGAKEVKCYNGGSAEYLYNNGYNRNDIITVIYQSSGDYFIILNRWRKNDITTYYFNCSTAAATAQKTVTAYTRLDPFAGQIIGIAFTNTNTAENPIINTKYANSGYGQRIKYNGQVITTSNLDKAGKAGHVTYYMFDGVYWVWMGEDNAPDIPIPTQADANKLLSVNASGNYELITIINSELIPY